MVVPDNAPLLVVEPARVKVAVANADGGWDVYGDVEVKPGYAILPNGIEEIENEEKESVQE